MKDLHVIKVKDPDSGEFVDYFECPSCEGMGYHNVYLSEYDSEEQVCMRCDGDGMIAADQLEESER